MSRSDVVDRSAVELVAAIGARVLSPLEVFDAFAARIDALEGAINAFVTLDLERARTTAATAEAALMRGEELGVLGGLPIGIKDLTDTAGLRTTYGSTLFADHTPERDASVVARLREAGAIIIGKTTTPEFGSHVVTQSPVSGITRNPWDRTRTPGGSSGGSAAAVAARMLPFAHGNDGGGSIRVPASFCGVFGFKPSYGLVSTAPSSDYYSTITHHGPLARSVSDGALLLRAMVGFDPRDPFSLPAPELGGPFADDLSLDGLRVAVSVDMGYATVDPEVAEVVRNAGTFFEQLGAFVEDAHPGVADPRPFFNRIIALHVAAGSVELLERRDELQSTMRTILEELDDLDPWDLARALADRSRFHERVIGFFDRYDLLVTPTMGALPPAADEPLGPDLRIEGLEFTHLFNLTHLPAASVPAGLSASGLPIGIQVVGGPRRDAVVLRACAAFERLSPPLPMPPLA